MVPASDEPHGATHHGLGQRGVDREGARQLPAALGAHLVDMELVDIKQGVTADGGAPGLHMRSKSNAMTAAVAETTPKESKNINKLNLLATERDKEGWNTQKGKHARKTQYVRAGDQYDVFLSYRVTADEKLVEDLYWRLEGMPVTANGVTRKLRVFWDKKCLRSGESWEAGFSRAICRSTVVVAVMSREALVSVATLTSDSPCDNVVLEYALSLSLAELKSTAIFPLFVGDKVKNDDAGLEQQIKGFKEQIKASATLEQDSSDLQDMKAQIRDLKKRFASLDERYTHYFRSGCHPRTPEPDIRVRQIDEKWATYVCQAKEALSLEDVHGLRPRTVKEIMEGMTQSQGHFLMGPARDALEGAVGAIHKCAQRLVEEQASSRLVEALQVRSRVKLSLKNRENAY